MKKTRVLSVLLVLALLASVLAACAGSTPAADAPAATEPAASTATEASDDATEAAAPAEEAAPTETEASGTLTLGIWPEDTMTDEIAMHEGFVKAFNEKHPGVEIVPAYYKYAPDTFIPLAQAGNMPTVFATWFTEPKKIINNGFAKDITDILEARGVLDEMNAGVKTLLSDENGRVYGVPQNAYPLGLMLNLEMFEAAGLLNEDGTAQYPKTWEELATTAKAIKDATGKAGLVLLAKDNAGGWHYSNIAWAYGATLSIDNGDGTYTANLNTPEAVAAMEYVKSLRWEYDVLTADPTAEDWGTGFTALGTGEAGMYLAAYDAVAQPTYTNGLNKDSLSLVPVPGGPAGQWSLFGGTPYMFSADATDEEVNWALDYLDIMGQGPLVTPEAIAGMEADAQYRFDNNIPVIPSFLLWDSPERQAEVDRINTEFGNVDMAKYQDYYDITAEPNNLRPEEPGLTQEMYGLLTGVIQACVTDQNADVQALMDQADADYQALLDVM
jgi:ABC-type glycerol-3-phosphate transport system substrate-binding protein